MVRQVVSLCPAASSMPKEPSGSTGDGIERAKGTLLTSGSSTDPPRKKHKSDGHEHIDSGVVTGVMWNDGQCKVNWSKGEGKGVHVTHHRECDLPRAAVAFYEEGKGLIREASAERAALWKKAVADKEAAEQEAADKAAAENVAAEKAAAERAAASLAFRRRWSRKGRELHKAAAEKAALQQAVADEAEAEAAAAEAEASPAAKAEAAPAAAAEAARPGPEAGTAVVDIKAKKSNLQGISWKADAKSWVLQWSKPGMSKQPNKIRFKQSTFTKPGMSSEEGCLEAFNAAKATRQKKVDEGSMKPHDAKKHEQKMRMAEKKKNKKVGLGRKEKFKGKRLPKSRVIGIVWNKRHCLWQVQPRIGGKQLVLGTFTPLNASAKEIQKARLAAQACLQEAQRNYGLPEA